MLKHFLCRVLVCPVTGHARSRDKVREVEGVYTSVCKRCDAPVRRLQNRRWAADRQARELRVKS